MSNSVLFFLPVESEGLYIEINELYVLVSIYTYCTVRLRNLNMIFSINSTFLYNCSISRDKTLVQLKNRLKRRVSSLPKKKNPKLHIQLFPV